MPDGWPCWAISNHDVERVVTRWGGADCADAPGQPAHRDGVLAARIGVRVPGRGTGPDRGRGALRAAAGSVRHRVLAQLQGSRRLPHADAVDRRRSMRGFSERRAMAAGAARAPRPGGEPTRSRSRLDHCTGSAPSWPGAAPSRPCAGATSACWTAAEPLLAFTRTLEGETVLACFNLSAEPLEVDAAVGGGRSRLSADHLLQGELVDGRLRLPAYGGCSRGCRAEQTALECRWGIDHAQVFHARGAWATCALQPCPRSTISEA